MEGSRMSDTKKNKKKLKFMAIELSAAVKRDMKQVILLQKYQ